MERDWLIVTEQWRRVPSYPDYEASSWGRVRRKTGGYGAVAGRILTPSLTDNYPSVAICHKGKEMRRTVHSLVAEAFIGARPEGHQVSHLNGDRADARPANLTYETSQANHLRKREHGTAPIGSQNPAAKLTDEQVASVRTRLAEGEPQAQIARSLSVTRQVIWFIAHGHTWKEAA